MKALIKVGYGCNEHCTFCHTQDVRDIQGDAAEVDAKIDRAKALGHTMVVLSGGEPTIRPELVRWAARVARLDMDFGLVTNGLALAYEELVEKLLALRLRYVYMSLHSGDPRVHDRVVRSDSFGAATRALANLAGRGLDLTVNCVVTRQNMDHLDGLVELVAPIAEAKLKFSAVEPKGGAMRVLDSVVPRLSDAAARVRAALRLGQARMPGRVRHGGFALCTMPGFEALYDDLRTHDFATMVEIGEPDFFPVDDRNKLHPRKCDGCRLRGPCPGTFVAYHERFGDGELAPVGEGPRSNAFDWVHEATLAAADDARCPLRDDGLGITPWDPARHLFVRHGGKVARYRSDTRDFGDTEIHAIKHRLGQVYLDASHKPAPDDFVRDLVPLRRSGLCLGCAAYDRCTGMFEPQFESPFERADEDLRARLAGLVGDVLEIGCGSGRTAGALAARMREGELRYTAIEPDADALAILRARLPAATTHVGTAEDVVPELPEAAFDHALVLQAWNHLRDPAAVLAALARVLRPDAVLIVTDDVAFGLARSKAQQMRARSSNARFEHHRNDDAGRAAARIGAVPGFALVERRDVGPTTGTQWLLRYRRMCS